MSKKKIYAAFSVLFLVLAVAANRYGDTESTFDNWVLGFLIFLGLCIGESGSVANSENESKTM